MAMRSQGRNKQSLTPRDQLPQNEEEQEPTSDDAAQEEDDENWSDVPPESSEQRTNAKFKQRRQKADLGQRAEEMPNRRESQNPFSKLFPERPNVHHSQTRNHPGSGVPPANPGGQIQVPPRYPPSPEPAGLSNPHNSPTDHLNDPNPSDAYPRHYAQPTLPPTGYPYPYTPYNGYGYPQPSCPPTDYPYPYTPYNGHSYFSTAQPHSFYPNGPLPPHLQQQRAKTVPSTFERKRVKIKMALDDVRAEREAAAREKEAIGREKEAIEREKEAMEREKEEMELEKVAIEREKEAVERETVTKEMAKMKRQMLRTLRRDIGLDVQTGRLDPGRARRVVDYGAGSLSPLARQVPLELLVEKKRRADSILEEFAQFLELKGRLEGRSLAQGGSTRGGSVVGSSAYGLDLTTRPFYEAAADPGSGNEIETMVDDCLTRILLSPTEQATDLGGVSPGGVPPRRRNFSAEAAEMKNKMAGYARPSCNEQEASPESSQLDSPQQDSPLPLPTPGSTLSSRTRREERKAGRNPLWTLNLYQKPKRADSGHGSVHAGPSSGGGNGRHSSLAVGRGQSAVSLDEQPRRKLPSQGPRASRNGSSQDSLRAESSSDEWDDAEAFPRRKPAPYLY